MLFSFLVLLGFTYNFSFASNFQANEEITARQFIEQQIQSMVDKIEKRPLNKNSLQSSYSIQIGATRNALTNWLYDKQFVEYSDLTLMFSDKLLMGKILQHYLRDEAPFYHPHVMGLKEFLEVTKLIDNDGVIIASEEQIKAAFKQHFPEGFILKPPVSWATDGKGFYAKEAEVIALLAARDAKLYEAKELRTPFLSPLAAKITSGERWMVMGKIKNTSISQNKNYGLSSEFRIHTFENYVIPAATLHRYGLDDDGTHFSQMNAFAQKLLDTLPRKLVQQQAWSFDVFLQSDGKPILIEVNTNRGEKTNWSDFLRTPEVVAGYVNFFENQYGWHFKGVEGKLLRGGVANVRSHLKHEFPYYMELVSTATPEEKKVILQDLKKVANDYSEALKLIKLNKIEKENKDYLVVEYVINSFKQRISKVKVIEDDHWNEFVAWTLWLQDWDGN